MAGLVAQTAVVVAGAAAAGGCGVQAKDAEAVAHRRCPTNDQTFAPSRDPLTAKVLVPAESIGVLVCRYWGSRDTGRRWTTAEQRYVPTGARVQRFVAKLNRLPPIPTSPPASCPEFGGRSVLLIFRYARRDDDPVRVLRKTCTSVSNGHIVNRWGLDLFEGEHWPEEGLI
jgi:hypothetical protein